MNISRLSYLLDRYVNKLATAGEEMELMQLLESEDNGEAALKVIGDMMNNIPAKDLPEQPYAGDVLQTIFAATGLKGATPVRRVHFLKTAWFRYAAVILLFIGVGSYFYYNRNEPFEVVFKPAPVKHDIVPGGNKAVLTLADGHAIVLDSMANGALATQGGTKIIKLVNGKLAYDLKGVADSGVLMNKITTPRGGQYQVTLPDGTKVWLNAASSITFPVSFTRNRDVSITGEVYMEVARKKNMPFRVSVAGMEVEVLGTDFNINAYEDEKYIKTTLIAGSVRVRHGDRMVMLKPGQQALYAASLKLNENPDMEEVLAWKNGVLYMNNTDLPSVMRRIARWYDVTIKFPQGLPGETITGKIPRSMSFENVLKVLEKSGVKLQLEGKTINVYP